MGFFNNSKTAKKALWLYEAHRCSACGVQNASKQKIILSYRYDEIALSRSAQDRMTRAGMKLSAAQQDLIRKAADREDVEKYNDLNLLGKCRACGHKEPWSRMRMRVIDAVFDVLIVMSFLAAVLGIVALFMDGGPIMLIAAGGLIAVTVGVFFLQRRHRKSRERAILELADEAIPFLTEDEEKFREAYPDIDPETLEKIEPSGNYQVTE